MKEYGGSRVIAPIQTQSSLWVDKISSDYRSQNTTHECYIHYILLQQLYLLIAKERPLPRKHTFFWFACKTIRCRRRRRPKNVAQYNEYNILVIWCSDLMINIVQINLISIIYGSEFDIQRTMHRDTFLY